MAASSRGERLALIRRALAHPQYYDGDIGADIRWLLEQLDGPAGGARGAAETTAPHVQRTPQSTGALIDLGPEGLPPRMSHEVEVCLGCGAQTRLRDCGCPAGTGWILARRECSGCGSVKAQCDAWKRFSHAACCPDCKHPEGQ